MLKRNVGSVDHNEFPLMGRARDGRVQLQPVLREDADGLLRHVRSHLCFWGPAARVSAPSSATRRTEYKQLPDARLCEHAPRA